MSKPTKTAMIYESWEQLAHEMINDIKRYDLPICFDAYDEVKAFYRRENRLKEIAQRWFRIYQPKTYKQ
jgi:hypothetical protein